MTAAESTAFFDSPEWREVCSAMQYGTPTLDQCLMFVNAELREAMDCLEPSAPANGRAIDGWHASACVLRAWATLTSTRFHKLLVERFQ